MTAEAERAAAGVPDLEARAFRRRLLALAACALLLRVAFAALEPPTRPVADERTWVNWALENLVTPKVRFSPLRTHMIFYPPAYPYFVAAVHEAAGGLAAVKGAQALLGALLVPAVGLLGARLFSRRAGLAAAAAVAFYPELVWFAAHFWSETLFLVPLWWALERLLAADEAASPRLAAVSGLLWGLAILTRETVLYSVPLAGLWLALSRDRPRRRLGAAAALCLSAALVVAPWTWRNWLVFHAFVPVGTSGGQNLFQGNARIPRDETYVMVDAVKGRIEQYRYARRLGIEAILERQPTWFLEKLREQMPNFWEADSLVVIHVKRGAYGSVEPGWARAAAVLVLAPYLGALALFVAGLALLPLRRGAWLLLGFLAYYNLIHVVTHGFARYRQPVLPVLFLFAGAAWVALRSRPLPRPTRARAIAAALAGAVLLLSLVPSLRSHLGHPAFGLTGSEESREGAEGP